MAGIKLTGNGGTDVEVDPNTRALRTTIKPIDVGSLGSYRLAVFSGLTATLAAGATVFSMRWTDATRLMILKYLRVRYAVVTGFTAAQELAFGAFMARSFSSSDSVGTAVVTSSNNAKKRTSMGPTLFAVNDVRVASASAVTAGTRTLDNNPILVGMGKTLAAAATVQDASFESILDLTNSQDYPIILAQNEGLVVQNTILMGAGGTVRIGIECAWDEVASF